MSSSKSPVSPIVPAVRPFKIDKRFSELQYDYRGTVAFQALKESIRCHGVLKPIILWENAEGNGEDVVVDGHYRLLAVDELRAEGHDVQDPTVKRMAFCNAGEAKLWVLNHVGAERPRMDLLDAVEKVEADKDIANHLTTEAKARQGWRGEKHLTGKSREGDVPEKSREGKRNKTVIEMKADMVELYCGKKTNESTYREALEVLKNAEAKAAVKREEYSIHHAADTIKAAKKKAVERKHALTERTKLPDWTNKTAGTNSLVHCDVLERWPYADASVDCIPTSPPYPVDNNKVKYIKAFFEGQYYGDSPKSYLSKTRKWIAEAYRVLKGDRYLIVNIDNCGPTKEDRSKGIRQYNCFRDVCEIAESVGFRFSDVYCWFKQNAVSNRMMAGSKEHPRGQRNWEFLIVFYKEPIAGQPARPLNTELLGEEWFKLSMSHWEINSRAATKDNPHPVPYPLELAERMVRLFSRRGEIVCDPFSGSGTTCAAAAKWGRQYVGMDINPNFFEYAEKRIQEAKDHAAKEAKNAPRRKVKTNLAEDLKRHKKWRTKFDRLKIQEAEMMAVGIKD